MPTYIFGSARGDDFEVNGKSPKDAYNNLVKREQDNGVLWRLNDDYYNTNAVKNRGFTYLDLYPHAPSIVYKENGE